MAMRHIVWSLTLLVTAIPLGFLGFNELREADIRARTAEYDTARREWIAAVRAQRETALENLDRIRAELAAGGAPEWAGEYSWSASSGPSYGLTESGTRGEGFCIAPEGGAVWWFGAADPRSARVLDFGRVVTADVDRVVVAWTIHALHPHGNPFDPAESPLLSDELVRVRDDDGDGLVPAVRMPAFCSLRHPDPLDPRSMAPRRGGFDHAHRAKKVQRGVVSSLHVPERWRSYVLTTPVVASARLERPVEVLRRRADADPDAPPAWWRRLTGLASPSTSEEHVRVRVCLSAGLDQGLQVGMPVEVAGEWGLSGTIVSVSPSAAHAELRGESRLVPLFEGGRASAMLTTRVP